MKHEVHMNQARGLGLSMKRVNLLTACFIFVAIYGKSEIVDSPKQRIPMPIIYAEFGVGDANGMMTGLGGNLVFVRYWGLNFAYSQVNRKSKSVPGDYDRGLCFFSCLTPSDKLYLYSCRVSKGFATRSQLIRFSLQAGMAWGQFQKVVFTPRVTTGWFDLGSNYSVSYTTHKLNGLTIRAVAEFPFSQLIGLQIAVSGLITPQTKFAGIEAFTTVGYVRARLRNRKIKHAP